MVLAENPTAQASDKENPRIGDHSTDDNSGVISSNSDGEEEGRIIE